MVMTDVPSWLGRGIVIWVFDEAVMLEELTKAASSVYVETLMAWFVGIELPVIVKVIVVGQLSEVSLPLELKVIVQLEGDATAVPLPVAPHCIGTGWVA
jgi:hypothetical protein